MMGPLPASETLTIGLLAFAVAAGGFGWWLSNQFWRASDETKKAIASDIASLKQDVATKFGEQRQEIGRIADDLRTVERDLAAHKEAIYRDFIRRGDLRGIAET
jgi:ABC-type transporter Mla subunit MlaD